LKYTWIYYNASIKDIKIDLFSFVRAVKSRKKFKYHIIKADIDH